jgi:hypothetical protein
VGVLKCHPLLGRTDYKEAIAIGEGYDVSLTMGVTHSVFPWGVEWPGDPYKSLGIIRTGELTLERNNKSRNKSRLPVNRVLGAYSE